jgi:hypothetical protein
MESFKTIVMQVCIIVLFGAFLSGCVTMDHAFYKDKHPHSTWGEYLYSRITRLP